MPTLPQAGGCLCGDVRYEVSEDPVTVYACHCTDCQTETGSAFYLAVVVRREALRLTAGAPAAWRIDLPDGRVKGSLACPRCLSKLWGESARGPVLGIDGGTFDDTSWIAPAGHIWVRSAQPWLRLPPEGLRFEQAPGDEGTLAMVRAWKGRDG